MVFGKYLSRKSNATRLLFPRRGEWKKLIQKIFTHFMLISMLFIQIRNVESQNCLDTMGHKSGEKVGSSYCHGLGRRS